MIWRKGEQARTELRVAATPLPDGVSPMAMESPELSSASAVIGDKTIQITWAIEGDTPTSVQLWCQPQSDQPNPISVPLATTTYTFKKLNPGTLYVITVLCLYDDDVHPPNSSKGTTIYLRTTGTATGAGGSGGSSGSGKAPSGRPTIVTFEVAAVAWNKVSVNYQIGGATFGCSALINRGAIGSGADPVPISNQSVAAGNPWGFIDSPLLPNTLYEYQLIVIYGPGPNDYVEGDGKTGHSRQAPGDGPRRETADPEQYHRRQCERRPHDGAERALPGLRSQ